MSVAKIIKAIELFNDYLLDTKTSLEESELDKKEYERIKQIFSLYPFDCECDDYNGYYCGCNDRHRIFYNANKQLRRKIKGTNK